MVCQKHLVIFAFNTNNDNILVKNLNNKYFKIFLDYYRFHMFLKYEKLKAIQLHSLNINIL